MATKKYVSLERLQEYHALLEDHIAAGDDFVKLYADGLAAGKADKEHIHDDIYYTEAEIDTKLEAVNASIAGITSGSTKVQDAVHADSSTSADEATHAATADNATEANHAISADSATKATQDAAGNIITEIYETKTDASAKLDEAKGYTDEKIANLLDNDTEAVDSIMELAEAMKTNGDAIDALREIAGGKADKEHTHTTEEIIDFSEKIETKLLDSQADWNENDESSLAYVKNRTHYVSTELVERYSVTYETIVTYDNGISMGDGFGYDINNIYYPMPDGWKNNEPMTVIFDDIKYESKMVYNNVGGTIIGVGNGLLATGTGLEDTGEPFFFGYWGGAVVAYSTTPGTHSFAIVEEQEVAIPLDEKFIPDTIARVSSVAQADWSINDESNPAYVKNRTHYEGINFVEIVPEQNVTINGSDMALQPSVNLRNGIMYRVLFDGKSYNLMCFDDAGYPTIGNSYNDVSGKYPFCIYCNNSAAIFLHTSSMTGVHTLAIYEEQGTTIVQLDEKFIPDTIARKEYVDEVISSINIETITFDEIDEICGFVTEGALLETDVDELMAQLED